MSISTTNSPPGFKDGYQLGLKHARWCVDLLLDELGRRAREHSLDDELRGMAFAADNNLMTCERAGPDRIEVDGSVLTLVGPFPSFTDDDARRLGMG